MRRLLSIRRRDAFSVIISGLAESEAALLQKALRTACSVQTGGTLVLHGSGRGLVDRLSALSADPAVPGALRTALATHLDNYLRTDYKIVLRGASLDLGGRTHVMGILNVTPDSFSDGGLFADTDAAVERARAMAAQGADIIDIGGESTRPGAAPLSEEDELRRVLPVIERCAAVVPAILSIDTYKSSVARRALEAGASMVNDISGLRFSRDMARVVADHGAALVVMHIKGTPRDMQQDPVYDDVMREIAEYLSEGIEIALKAGVDPEKILVDPGIGFGKTVEHNLEILDRLDELRSLGRPVVIGTSRKRFIGAVLGQDVPADRLMGTAATVALAIERGAQVIRVHDIGPMAMIARMTDAILKHR